MAVSPIQTKEQTFKKSMFGGYNVEHVTRFLRKIETDRQNLERRNSQLEESLLEKNREIERYKNMEDSLVKSLSQVQEANKLTIEQARKEADSIVMEAQIEAQRLLQEAEMKANQLVQEALQERKQVVYTMKQEVNTLMGQYKELEHHRQNLLGEVQTFLHSTLNKINQLSLHPKVSDFEAQMAKAYELLNKSQAYFGQEATKQQPDKQLITPNKHVSGQSESPRNYKKPKTEQYTYTHNTPKSSNPLDNLEASFFDELS